MYSDIRTSFLAVAPRQSAAERVHRVQDVEEGPGDDDDVVDVLQEDHGECGVADALEDGADLADDAHAAHAEVLADRHLQQEEGDAAAEERDEVGDEESA